MNTARNFGDQPNSSFVTSDSLALRLRSAVHWRCTAHSRRRPVAVVQCAVHKQTDSSCPQRLESLESPTVLIVGFSVRAPRYQYHLHSLQQYNTYNSNSSPRRPHPQPQRPHRVHEGEGGRHYDDGGVLAPRHLMNVQRSTWESSTLTPLTPFLVRPSQTHLFNPRAAWRSLRKKVSTASRC